MSAEIKPGQVWAWNDGRTGPGPEITVTSLGEYVGGDARVNYSYSGMEDVFDVDLASFRKKAHLVKDVATTPAPLDPSKVKAGDTVTVHVVTIDSPAYDVAGEAYMLGHGLAVGGHMLTGHGVTLTAHQPAPMEDRVGFLHDYLAGRGDSDLIDGLVVIDPASVDVDALVEVAHHDRVLYGDTTPDQMRRAILRILAHMGIEASR